jgi:hypothetical protein
MNHWIVSISGVGMLLCGGTAFIFGTIWFCSAVSREADTPLEERRKSKRVGWLALVLGTLAVVQFYLFFSAVQRSF